MDAVDRPKTGAMSCPGCDRRIDVYDYGENGLVSADGVLCADEPEASVACPAFTYDMGNCSDVCRSTIVVAARVTALLATGSPDLRAHLTTISLSFLGASMALAAGYL
jgi:hypothetical protein